MLSKSAARTLFLIGTIGFSVIFLGLTVDTISLPIKQAAMFTPQVIQEACGNTTTVWEGVWD